MKYLHESGCPFLSIHIILNLLIQEKTRRLEKEEADDAARKYISVRRYISADEDNANEDLSLVEASSTGGVVGALSSRMKNLLNHLKDTSSVCENKMLRGLERWWGRWKKQKWNVRNNYPVLIL